MKKAIICAVLGIATFTIISCGNSEETKTHSHDDGSTHADHDTTRPVQQDFVVGDSTVKDTTVSQHTHKDGEKHTH